MQAKPDSRYLYSLTSTKLHGGVHEVEAKGVVNKANVIGQGGAVARCVEAVDGVGDKGVHGVGGGDEGIDVGGEGGQVCVEVVVGSQEGVQLVLQILVQVDSGVPVVDQGLGVGHDCSVGLGVARALPSADVAVGYVANPPGVVILGLEFLVEGNAGGS